MSASSHARQLLLLQKNMPRNFGAVASTIVSFGTPGPSRSLLAYHMDMQYVHSCLPHIRGGALSQLSPFSLNSIDGRALSSLQSVSSRTSAWPPPPPSPSASNPIRPQTAHSSGAIPFITSLLHPMPAAPQQRRSSCPTALTCAPAACRKTLSDTCRRSLRLVVTQSDALQCRHAVIRKTFFR